MINELYRLSSAMKRANIDMTESTWHREYKPIPNVSRKAPCIQIVLSKQGIKELRRVSEDKAKTLRKYGDNQAAYPAMNIASLYRVVPKPEGCANCVPEMLSESALKQLKKLREGELKEFDIAQIHSWCIKDNWNSNLKKKLERSIKNKAEQLSKKLKDLAHPIHLLISQTNSFADLQKLRQELEEQAFLMLKEKVDIQLAVQLLFHIGDSKKETEKDCGSLSVIFDSDELDGCSTVTSDFTGSLNRALLEADEVNQKSVNNMVDAFGIPCTPSKEPMPSVKLAGGFDASLRTMFKGQPCQKRYGRFENDSYPLSQQLRQELSSALTWVSDGDRKGVTWANISKDEILFAYCLLRNIKTEVAKIFKQDSEDKEIAFESKVERFLSCLKANKDPKTDSVAEHIQIFILKKLDEARRKIIYTYNTTPQEIETHCEEWFKGCQNFVSLNKNFVPHNIQKSIFPLSVSTIMNRVWKQNGELLDAQKFKPYRSYYGLELLFNSGKSAISDLSALLRNIESVAPFWSKLAITSSNEYKKKKEIYQTVILLGLLLYKLEIKKECYMQEFPYLYGQLLKAADELHMLYCKIVRKGQIPSQLIGGSLYNSAAARPYQTMAQLAQRINPYFNWAKSYRYKSSENESEETLKNRRLVGWCHNLFEQFATKIKQTIKSDANGAFFTDVERAQLFIGYLAEFPKKQQNDKQNGGINDEQ